MQPRGKEKSHTEVRVESDVTAHISAIREFNRFYTAKLGLLRRRHLDGRFSLTEARILYEIGAGPKITASILRAKLELDAGYISRLLSSLTRQKLLRQAASATDAREKHLTLTATGQKAVDHLNQQSTIQIQRILAQIHPAGREALAESLTKARSILSVQPSIRIVRLTAANLTGSNEDALAILHEYYEAVHVVQRDKPSSIQKIVDVPASGIWLAYLADEVAGCVVLRKLASIPRAAECKRLYVKPSARGNHIAGKLLDAQEAFARNQGLEWIYLDSYDDLKAAIALYKKRGYQPCKRYNDNPQATLFMRKRLAPLNT